MPWVYLFVGALFEIAWAVGLKLSEGFTVPLYSTITVICIVISFALFTIALKSLDVGTSYAIFTGVGAVGTALIGMLFLGDSGGIGKIFFIVLLITGIIGLKMTDSASSSQVQEG